MTTGRALSARSRVVASPDQTACQIGAETVILSMSAGRYYGFASVGTRIWQLIQEPTTIDEVRRAITSAYQVDAARCEADVLAFVERLIAAGLARQLDAPAG